MLKTLALFAHPNYQASRANRKICEALERLPHLTFRPLYKLYPEFHIDVKREQALLLEHDVILFQHPFYWYSMPPLLKLWFDLVLEYNFAYGPKGTRLAGKIFQLSITAGGPLESYCEDGYNYFSVNSLLAPYKQTATLCGMKWQEPLVLYHSLKVNDADLGAHVQSVVRRVSELGGAK